MHGHKKEVGIYFSFIAIAYTGYDLKLLIPT